MPVDHTVLLVVQVVAAAFDLEPAMLLAVGQVESGWNLHALGDYDAETKVPRSFGPMQLNKGGAGAGFPDDLLLNYVFNIFRGAQYLRECLDAYPKDIRLGLASYRQGIEGASKNGWGPSEEYVQKIMDAYQLYKKDGF